VKENTGRFWYLAVLMLLGVLAAVVWFASLSGFQLVTAQFNVDSLFIPLVTEDIIHRGGKLTDWHMNQAPLFIPDMLISAILTVLVGDPIIRVVAAAVIQVLLTFAAIWYLAAKTVQRRYPVYALLALVIILWEGFIPEDRFVDKFFMHIFAHIFALTFHYGTFICVLLLACFWFAVEDKERPGGGRALIAFILVFCVLGGASDLLFIAQAGAPLMATALLIYGVNSAYSRRRVLVPAAAFACAVAGAVLYRHLNDKAPADNLTATIDVILAFIPIRLRGLHYLMSVVMSGTRLYTVLLAGYLVLVMFAFVRLFTRQAQTDHEKNLLFLTVYSFASIAATLLAQFLFAPDDIVDRYSIPLFFFPLIIPALYLGQVRVKGTAVAALCLCVGMTAVLAGNVINHVGQFGARRSHYSEIACIDAVLAETGARHGIAEYWFARALLFFSTHELRTAQFDFPALLPHPSLASERYFGDGYDFIIIPEVNASEDGKKVRTEIVGWNGEPRREAVCSGLGVLVYDEGELRVSPLSRAGESYRQNGCELGLDSGKRLPDCTAEVDTNGYPGDARFISMFLKNLPAGRYNFDAEYISPAAAATEVAEWRVMMFGRSFGETKKGSVYGSEGKPSLYSGEFVVSPDQEGNETQITLFVKPGNSFKQIHIEARRLE
jgi:hypothetical protein